MHSDEHLSAASAHDVQFSGYDETGDWITWSDTRISLRMPRNWQMKPDAEIFEVDAETSEDEAPMYTLRNESAKAVMYLWMYEGGEWNEPWACIPRELWQHTEKPPYEFWSVNADCFPNQPGGKKYGFRVASKTRRLAVIAVLPDDDPHRLIYIAQSARPVEP